MQARQSECSIDGHAFQRRHGQGDYCACIGNYDVYVTPGEGFSALNEPKVKVQLSGVTLGISDDRTLTIYQELGGYFPPLFESATWVVRDNKLVMKMNSRDQWPPSSEQTFPLEDAQRVFDEHLPAPRDPDEAV